MSFEEYLASLAPFAPGAAAIDPDVLLLCERATATVRSLDPLTQPKLAKAVAQDPASSQCWLPSQGSPRSVSRPG
jgi:hypothetical protein